MELETVFGNINKGIYDLINSFQENNEFVKIDCKIISNFNMKPYKLLVFSKENAQTRLGINMRVLKSCVRVDFRYMGGIYKLGNYDDVPKQIKSFKETEGSALEFSKELCNYLSSISDHNMHAFTDIPDTFDESGHDICRKYVSIDSYTSRSSQEIEDNFLNRAKAD